jgi:hypothetical protein
MLVQSQSSAYLDNPNPGDVSCIEGISRARKDIAAGKKVIIIYTGGVGAEGLRYENELALLIRQHGFTVDYEMENCIIFEGQTDGCYAAYMNRHVKQRHGTYFISNLHLTADSLFTENLINSEEVFSHMDYHTPPVSIDEDGEPKAISSLQLSSVLPEVKLAKDSINAHAYIDLHMIIDKNGNVTKTYFKDFSIQPKSLRKYRDVLLTAVRKHLNDAALYWLPAEKYAIFVNAEHSVRIKLD